MDEFLVAEDRVKGVEVVVGEPAAVYEDHPTALELFNRFSEGRGGQTSDGNFPNANFVFN